MRRHWIRRAMKFVAFAVLGVVLLMQLATVFGVKMDAIKLLEAEKAAA